MPTNRTIAVYLVSVIVPLIIVSTLLGVFLSSNDDKDEDAGYAIAQVPEIGRLRGFLSNESTAIFYGIPFAQTTAGEYRWTKPRDPIPVDYSKTVDAFQIPKACPQVCMLPSPEYSCPDPKDMSEDCLNLNVYLPNRFLTKERSHYVLRADIKTIGSPVMVFIYGGAFIAGGNAIPLYDGRYLAEKGDIIVVALNYRIGPFGFFYQNNGKPNAALGNFGIYDQIKALQWVKKHISEFGGDPNQVTIFGQSAGAQSVAILLLNYEVDDLFQQAIMQSNPFGLPYKTPDDAQKIADEFAIFANCTPNDLNCLRELTMEQMLYVYKNLPYPNQMNWKHMSEIFEPWSPILDKILLDDDPMILFNQGKDQNKPMIIGAVKDEGALFIEEIFDDPLQSAQAYNAIGKLMFLDRADAVLERYPPQCPPIGASATVCDERLPMNDIVTDYMFHCAQRRAMNSTSRYRNKEANIWFYIFDETWSFPQFWENINLCYDLVCHSGELPYLFDIDKLTEYRFSSNEAIMAERLIQYWVNFAKYGDPNGPDITLFRGMTKDSRDISDEKLPGQIYWPKIYEESQKYTFDTYRGLHITGPRDTEIVNYKKDECDFWDNLDFYLENYRTGPDERFKSMVKYWLEVKELLDNGSFI